MARPRGFRGLLAIALLAAGCGREGSATAAADGDESAPAALGPTVAPQGAPAGGPRFEFVDVAGQAGIDVVNVCGDPRRWYIVESNGNGAAWLDYDRDGDMDLFVGNGAGLAYVDDGKRLEVLHTAASRLYRNDGGWLFADVTAEAGAGRSEWINAVTVADYDNDGDSDLYLACFGRDVLLRNDGGRFADATAEAGLGCELWGAGAAFGDADNDGDLDLYVANYVLFDPEHPPDEGRRAVIEGVEVGIGPEAENQRGLNTGAPDVFYRNQGEGRFVEATAQAGLELPAPLCSYAVVFSDVDGDGWQDLLVANDLQPCNLFHNRGDGTFEEQGQARGFATDGNGKPTSAMGLVVEDVDGDGDMDVLRTNFDLEPNSLHVNDGQGRFTEVAAQHGLAQPSLDKLGWGAAFLDAECDGDLDLLVANGHVYPQAREIGMSGWLMPSQLYEASSASAAGVASPGMPQWRDVTAGAGPGLAPLQSARGLALADVDDDGDSDAVIIDMDGPPRLLENRSARQGRWISVLPLGTVSNRDGFGARVTVTAGGRTWTREMRTNQGLYSSHDPRLHFGLGSVERIDRVEVAWPSGRTSRLENPPLDAPLVVREP
ncbi:MAG TPA: CRTAC1 family protein [Planctomycetota bacterium]|nr:CRTAC1 family protein [Planctomycetota bacterium]